MILNAAIQFVSRVHRGFHHVVYSTVNRKSPRTSNLPPANTFLRPPFREHFWKNQTPDLQRHFQILNHLGLSIGRIGRTREPLELTSHCDFLFLRGGVLTPRPLASFYRVDFFRLMNTLDRGELGVVKIRDEYSWHSARIFFFDTHSLHASELGSCDHVSRNQKRVNSSATFRPPPPKLGTIHMPVT
jgi:hypothetical protein